MPIFLETLHKRARKVMYPSRYILCIFGRVQNRKDFECPIAIIKIEYFITEYIVADNERRVYDNIASECASYEYDYVAYIGV